jgi:predicted nucleic acid-binding protein
MVLVDTSALFALVVHQDRYHARAVAAFERLRRDEVALASTSYVLLESYSLLASRSGLPAVRAVRRDLEPLLEVSWVDEALHDSGVARWLDGPRGISLVDAVSFEFMRRQRMETAWSYDADFEAEGFRQVG